MGYRFSAWLESWDPMCLAAKKKTQNIKQKQYCYKLNKNFKDDPHQKKKKSLKKTKEINLYNQHFKYWDEPTTEKQIVSNIAFAL